MSENNQFYADNEKGTEGLEKEIDLSLAYEIHPNSVPEEEWEDQKIIFFCHDCGKKVDAEKNKKGIRFKCSICDGNQISFGTEKSIQNFFHLNEEGVQKK